MPKDIAAPAITRLGGWTTCDRYQCPGETFGKEVIVLLRNGEIIGPVHYGNLSWMWWRTDFGALDIVGYKIVD